MERAEYRIFCLAVTDAVRLAMAGQIDAGYACLRSGLEHAQELVDGDAEWARGLVEDYQCALRHYDDLVNQQRQALYRYALLHQVMQQSGRRTDSGVSVRSRFRTMMGESRVFQLAPKHWISPN